MEERYPGEVEDQLPFASRPSTLDVTYWMFQAKTTASKNQRSPARIPIVRE
jgi:hypothetical protein